MYSYESIEYFSCTARSLIWTPLPAGAMYLGEQEGVFYAIHIWNADAELSMTAARVVSIT